MTENVVPLRPDVSGRAPPCDLDAEGMVLSTLLQYCETTFDRVYDLLQSEHFYADANRRIFDAIVTLQLAAKQVDVVAVATELRNQGRLAQVGGTPYLATLSEYQPATAYIEQHVQTIVNKWKVRQVLSIGQIITAEGYGAIGNEQEWIEKFEQSISELAHHDRVGTMEHVAQAGFTEVQRLQQARERGQLTTGISTGLTDLDQIISGLHDGDLNVIAGRPGMGKTSLVTTLIHNVAKPRPDAETLPEGVFLWSGEMPRAQVALRIVCSHAGIDLEGIRKYGPSKEQYTDLVNAVAALQHYPIWIDDKPGRSVLEIRAIAKKLNREILNGTTPCKARRLSLVAVDYLQLMKGVRRQGGSSREQEIASISLGLKEMAKELLLPVAALSQLNRAVENRNSKDKRPQLSDLRESGAIENDADNVLLLYRRGYYDKSEKDGETEIIVAKQRNGPPGTAFVYFDAKKMVFKNLDRSADFSDWDTK